MGVSIPDRVFAIYVEYPYSWRQDIMLKSDEQMRPMRTVEDAVKEAMRWYKSGSSEDSTQVTVYEEMLRVTP